MTDYEKYVRNCNEDKLTPMSKEAWLAMQEHKNSMPQNNFEQKWRSVNHKAIERFFREKRNAAN